MPDEYEPGTGPFDWERSRDYWSRRTANDSILRAGEFYAVVDNINAKLDALHDRMAAMDERLFDVRAKRFAGEVVSSVWGRFLVVVLAVLTAFFLTSVGGVRWRPW